MAINNINNLANTAGCRIQLGPVKVTATKSVDLIAREQSRGDRQDWTLSP